MTPIGFKFMHEILFMHRKTMYELEFLHTQKAKLIKNHYALYHTKLHTIIEHYVRCCK